MKYAEVHKVSTFLEERISSKGLRFGEEVIRKLHTLLPPNLAKVKDFLGDVHMLSPPVLPL